MEGPLRTRGPALSCGQPHTTPQDQHSVTNRYPEQLIAFDRRGTFDAERGDLRVWLFGVATNLVARHRRKEARHYKALARVGVPPAAEGHEGRVVASVTASRLLPQLATALSQLSQGERDVLLLVALGQLSYEEVAAALGISTGTVGSRLSRARKKLNSILTQETSE